MDTDQSVIAKLNSQSKYFIQNRSLTENQLISLDKVITLFKEPDDQAQPSATKSRRRKARKLLLDILHAINDDVFILCVLALPITLLGEIRKPDLFLQSLREWWTNAKVHTNLKKVVAELCARYKSDLFPSIPSRPSLKRPVDQAGSNKRLRLDILSTEKVSEIDGCDGDQRGSADGIDYRRGTDETEEDEEDEEADDNEDSPGKDMPVHGISLVEALEKQQGLLSGAAYMIKPMDAIFVLASETPDVMLTIPYMQGTMPFFTVVCSQKLAQRILRKRKQDVDF